MESDTSLAETCLKTTCGSTVAQQRDALLQHVSSF